MQLTVFHGSTPYRRDFWDLSNTDLEVDELNVDLDPERCDPISLGGRFRLGMTKAAAT